MLLLEKKLPSEICKKSDYVIWKIVASYNGEGHFNVVGKLVTVTREDIILIFGIRCGTQPFPDTMVRRSNLPFVKRRHLKQEKFSAKNMKNMISELISSQRKQDIEDLVRLVCMVLCVTLFFPTSGTSISWSHVALLEDFDKMLEFDWA